MKKFFPRALALMAAPLVMIAACLSCQAAPVQSDAPAAPDRERTELWTGKILSATFEAGMCYRENGKVRGVFLLTHASGDTDVYHVYGEMRNGEVEARHQSGHVFKVRVEEDGTIKGSVRVKNRIGLTMKGHSTPNVPLTEDCSPQP